MLSFSLASAAIVVAVLLCAVLHVRKRARHKRLEEELLARFSPVAEFIGKDLDCIVAKAGPITCFGGMDHGRDVAQWMAGTLVVEAWFQYGRCTEIEVRQRKR